AHFLFRHPGESRDPGLQELAGCPWTPAFAGVTKKDGQRTHPRSPSVSPKGSALPARAVEAGAPRLHDALDAAGRLDLAGAARAGVAFMLVDLPAMLEIAELAIRLDIVAQR